MEVSECGGETEHYANEITWNCENCKAATLSFAEAPAIKMMGLTRWCAGTILSSPTQQSSPLKIRRPMHGFLVSGNFQRMDIDFIRVNHSLIWRRRRP